MAIAICNNGYRFLTWGFLEARDHSMSRVCARTADILVDMAVEQQQKGGQREQQDNEQQCRGRIPDEHRLRGTMSLVRQRFDAAEDHSS